MVVGENPAAVHVNGLPGVFECRARAPLQRVLVHLGLDLGQVEHEAVELLDALLLVLHDPLLEGIVAVLFVRDLVVGRRLRLLHHFLADLDLVNVEH